MPTPLGPKEPSPDGDPSDDDLGPSAGAPRVVCVGDVMLDVVAHLAGPLAPGSDTPAPVTFHGGGAAANVAAWLVAVGADATFVGAVGDDDAGRTALRLLRSAGVRVSVAVDPARPTGTCLVLVDPSGERTMIPHAGANDSPGGPLPDDADALYVSGYALFGAGSRPGAITALTCARDRGWTVAVDAASAAPLATAPDFASWVGTGVLLFANDDEAAVFGADVRELGALFGAAVVKHGADGAEWSDGRNVERVAALPVPAVDTTGAGDAFAAGFLAATLAGAAPAAALAAGAELAARAVTRPGARPGSG